MKLFKHQQQAIPWAASNAFNVALFWEPRCGKTYGTLEIFQEARKTTPNLRLFVGCPMSLITNVWQRNVVEKTNLTFKEFKDIKPDRAGNIHLPDVTALNFESIISKKQLPILRSMIIKNPYMCVIDESTKIAEPKSQTTKTILSLTHFFKSRMILTGSEIRNSELDYWSQISFIQPGLLPQSFYAFRNIYFYLTKDTLDGEQALPQMPTPITWDYLRGVIEQSEQSGTDFNLVRRAKSLLMKYSKCSYVPFPAAKEIMAIILSSGYHYCMRADKREQLINLIKPYCMWVKKKDCFDLPPTSDQERDIYLTDAETDAYLDMQNYLVAQIGNDFAAAPVALAKLMKLRQGTSGFFYGEDGKVLVSGKSKLNELEDVLEEIGKQQMVIYAEFKYEFESIVALIDKKYGPGKVVTMYGDTTDRDDSIRRFESGDAQYIVAHPRSAAHGLDFQFCSIMLFFSWSHSNELMTQARERLMGPKQDKKALYIYLVAKLKNGDPTIDQDMLDVVRGKATIQEAVYHIVQRVNQRASKRGSHVRNKSKKQSVALAQKAVPASVRI